MQRLFVRMLVLATMLCGMSASAILIDFEDYIVGQELHGQPATGTKWGGISGSFIVTNELSAQGKCVQMTANATQYATTYFTPSDSDFGGSQDTNRVYLYSFDIKLLENRGTSTAKFIDVWIGRNFSPAGHIARLGSYGNGNFGVANGQTYAGVLSDGEWHTISGEFEYVNHTYSLAIDGEVKFTGQTFSGGTNQYAFGYFGLNVTTAEAGNIDVRVDNVYLQVKPAKKGTIIILK